MGIMVVRNGPLDRALANLRRIDADLRDELATSRKASGLSRRELGVAVGLSKDRIGRFERGELRDLDLEQIVRMAAGLGLKLSVRLFPDGDPIRDVGQFRLLERLRVRLPPTIRLRLEVPLFGRSDFRAWDAVADGHGCVDAIEAETRLADGQASIRRIMLKARDDRTVGHVILLVADTPANRMTLRLVRASLRASFPLDTRTTLARLAAGHCPGANAVVVL
jgi:transcriptional regulator with XRE-family HTH domain